MEHMPNHWTWEKLGEVCKTTSGGTPSRKKPEYYQGNIPWVKSGELNHKVIRDTEEHISEEAVKNSSAKIFPEGTLLIALYGATIGKLGVLGVPATTNQAVCGIFKNGIFETKFLFNYLFLKKQKLIGQGAGGAQPNISQTILKRLPLPITPLPEQRAIVSKIEQLFSELDNGIANLKAAKDKLEIYRQAVLKKAFEGKSFTEFKIEDITEKVQIGPFGSQLHKEDYIDDGIPLINPMHIKDGKIRPRKDYSISKEKRNQLPNYILENGDVIMGRRGEMGRCALVTEKEQGWFCGTGSLYLRPEKSKIDPPFLFYYIGSPIVKEHLTGSATGTTMMNLNKKIVHNLPISVPGSIAEQTQIVQEIESRLSVCDHILANIEEGLEKCEALHQSILKQAFEGRLLSEAEVAACRKAPDWESAKQLLERIKKQKVKISEL